MVELEVLSVPSFDLEHADKDDADFSVGRHGPDGRIPLLVVLEDVVDPHARLSGSEGDALHRRDLGS